MALELWTIYEIEYRREGVIRRPVTEALVAEGRVGERVQAIGAMKLLRALGWPEATRVLEIETVAAGIHQLKRKPGCWRIYFHVLKAEKAFLLLHAVCKKKQKRKARDTDKASTRLGEYQARKASRTIVDL